MLNLIIAGILDSRLLQGLYRPDDQRRLPKSIPLLLVLVKLPVPGRPTIWITVGQGPTAGVLCCAGVQIYIQTFCVEFFRSLVDHFRI